MKKIVHLTAEEVIEMQKRLLVAFGGSGGLRDRGLLESALYRPRSGYYTTIFEQAAALLESLIKNHPFIDGNKRVAWTATKVFLLANGHHLKTSADIAEKFLIDSVISANPEISTIASWLEQNSSKPSASE
jgi:death-on-curing protein